jgi:glycosyltransferase involved in cell wall biosynthesis
MSLAIVIPTKNESERLKTLFPELYNVIPQVDVVIVNTPVPNDTTKQVAELYNAKYIENPSGFGKCLSQGLLLCQDHDYVITMDADHDPNSAKLMYNTLQKMPETYDLAIGIEQSSRIQRDVVNALMSEMLGITQKNPTCGLRCYRGLTIPHIVPQNPDEWFFIQIQLLHNIIKHGKKMGKKENIVEVPFPPAHHTGITENTKFYRLFFTSLLKLWFKEAIL